MRNFELNRRRTWVVYLTALGASAQQIADALGVTRAQVVNDRVVTKTANGRLPRMTRPLIPIPNWRDADAPTPRHQTSQPRSDQDTEETVVKSVRRRRSIPPYQRSVTLQLCRDFVSTLEHDNAVNRLSHDAIDADEADDDAWYSSARDALAGVIGYAERLQRVLDDRAARERGAYHHGERDDMRSLRVAGTDSPQ